MLSPHDQVIIEEIVTKVVEKIVDNRVDRVEVKIDKVLKIEKKLKLKSPSNSVIFA